MSIAFSGQDLTLLLQRGANQTGAPYTNPIGTNGLCATTCTPSDTPHLGDGFKACYGYKHIMTVWRQ